MRPSKLGEWQDTRRTHVHAERSTPETRRRSSHSSGPQTSGHKNRCTQCTVSRPNPCSTPPTHRKNQGKTHPPPTIALRQSLSPRTHLPVEVAARLPRRLDLLLLRLDELGSAKAGEASNCELQRTHLCRHTANRLLRAQEQLPQLVHERRGAVLVHEPDEVDLHLLGVGDLVSAVSTAGMKLAGRSSLATVSSPFSLVLLVLVLLADVLDSANTPLFSLCLPPLHSPLLHTSSATLPHPSFPSSSSCPLPLSFLPTPSPSNPPPPPTAPLPPPPHPPPFPPNDPLPCPHKLTGLSRSSNIP